MTTQNSFSDARKASPNKRFFNKRFFGFNLKTGWPMLVSFASVFILTLIVPSISYITGSVAEYDTLYRESKIIKGTAEFLYTIGAVNIVVSMFMGFAAGICTMWYTNNKTGTNFYHSLPMRRESLFITSSLRGLVYYVTAFTTGLILVYSAFCARLGNPGVFIRPILLTFEYGLVFFFLLYAMTLFANSLTGTGLMRFIGAGYVIFLPTVLASVFILSVYICGMSGCILSSSYYFSLDIFCYLLPPLRLFRMAGDDAENRFTLYGPVNTDLVIVLVTAVVLFAVAFVLYRIRPSESASKTIIWKPAAFVFKYASMFIGGTVFGMIFSGIFGDVIWMSFGIIFGCTVTFMLTNGILHKSARAIFSGLRGFIIFMAVMACITAVFYVDVFGMFKNIPDGSFVSEVELSFDNVNEKYSGDFAVKVTDMLKEAHEKSREREPDYDEKYYHLYEYGNVVYDTQEFDYFAGYNYDQIMVNAVFHTDIGIPYAVELYVNCEDICELAQFVYAKDESLKSFPEVKDVMNAYPQIFIGYDWNYDDLYDNADALLKMTKELKDPFLEKCESPVVGCLNFDVEADGDGEERYSYYGYDRYYYVTAADYEILNLFNDGEDFTCEDDVIRYFIEETNITKITVVNNETGEKITVDDEEAIFEAVKSSWSFDEYVMNSHICGKDHTYNVFADMTRVYETEYGEEEERLVSMHMFRKGAVPDFVTESSVK